MAPSISASPSCQSVPLLFTDLPDTFTCVATEQVGIRWRPTLLMMLEWSLDGAVVSIMVDMETTPPATIGIAMQNTDTTWTAYDCTRSNQHGTTSFPIGTRSSRQEAKNLVEECFRSPRPDGPQGQLKADFKPDAWALAVERRWSEVCDLLDNHISGTHVLQPITVSRLLHELASLHLITQYAGSNARTGWLIAIRGYCEAIEPDALKL